MHEKQKRKHRRLCLIFKNRDYSQDEVILFFCLYWRSTIFFPSPKNHDGIDAHYG